VEDSKGVLEATTLLAELNRQHPGQFSEGQLRTLQRRVRQWRAVRPERPRVPAVTIGAPDLKVYDALLAEAAS